MVGAGVVGLSVAIRLLQSGWDVQVVAEREGADGNLVSAGSGGFWFPYLIEPMDRAGKWAADAYTEFVRMAEEVPEETGVRMRPVSLIDDLEAEVRGRDRAPPQPWLRMVDTV